MTQEQFERIEALLVHQIALRKESIELQKLAISLQEQNTAEQRELNKDIRSNIELAKQVNNGALQFQQRAKKMQLLAAGLLVFLAACLVLLLNR